MRWFRLLCAGCGINTELLMNQNERIFCRSCLDKYGDCEEVENECDLSEGEGFENQQGWEPPVFDRVEQEQEHDMRREERSDENIGGE